MKALIRSLLIITLISIAGPVLADTVEVGVPIVVENDRYTVVSKPDYYYYSGHRCYTEKRTDLGVNFLGLRAGIDGGTEIYCYPYP